MGTNVRLLVLMLMMSLASSNPVSYHEPDTHPLADLGQRLVSHSSLLDTRSQDPRLPIPTPQDIEAIKKVAQILVMLGEQHNQRNQAQIEMLNSIVDTLRTLKPKSVLSWKHKYVIPAIMGDSGSPNTNPPPPVEEIPNDPVEAN